MNRITALLLILVLLLITGSVALGQSPAYTITRHSFHNSGALAGGSYHLNAMAGQPEVSVLLTGQIYQMVGGSRPAPIRVGPAEQHVYLPLVAGGR